MEAAVAVRSSARCVSPDAAAAERTERLVWIFLAVGAALRIGRYCLRFPLWGDELMLASSFLDRDYGDFFRPLDLNMCAPLLFVWSVLTAVKLGGFSEWTLRLVPLISGLVGLLVFRHVARRLLTGLPLVAAVAIFSISYYPIRHVSELRAYCSDLTVSLVLLAMAVEWRRDPSRSRWMWALAAATPIALGFSYPAVFTAGGLCLALAMTAWKRGSRTSQLAFLVFTLAIPTAFGLYLKLSFATQYVEAAPGMTRDWSDAFPPLTAPVGLVTWIVGSFTGELVAYPFGDDRGGSLLTTLAMIVGIAAFLRKGVGFVPGALAGMYGLAFVAAGLHLYPLGGERCTQYLVPFICLLAGTGVGEAMGRIRDEVARCRVFFAATTIYAVAACGLALFFAVKPYKHVPDELHRGLARWFWHENAIDGRLVCLYSDEGQTFGVEKPHEYLSFQRIYSPRHHRAERQTIADGTGTLRCASFHSNQRPWDENAVEAWLTEMGSQYDFVGRSSYPIQFTLPHMPLEIGVYELFEFRPKGGAVVETARKP